ncbi:auxin-repressed 12.5 kDa protein [Iris pallida]|uniref:Auxin-repressed 12.5 kDa protein n=1 Tax=Iris pallida TaxID=29817 RepID=A0AAX6GFU8_IRIPA|nr:auxin-repressed 12.5 kDa protein [Iris pallida]
MVLLDKMWDDVVWGPNPDKGLGKLRKQLAAKPLTTKDDAGESSSSSSKYQRSASMPAAPMIASPQAPGTPVLSPAPAWKPNMWSSVFDPGSNLNTRYTHLTISKDLDQLALLQISTNLLSLLRCPWFVIVHVIVGRPLYPGRMEPEYSMGTNG